MIIVRPRPAMKPRNTGTGMRLMMKPSLNTRASRKIIPTMNEVVTAREMYRVKYSSSRSVPSASV